MERSLRRGREWGEGADASGRGRKRVVRRLTGLGGLNTADQFWRARHSRGEFPFVRRGTNLTMRSTEYERYEASGRAALGRNVPQANLTRRWSFA